MEDKHTEKLPQPSEKEQDPAPSEPRQDKDGSLRQKGFRNLVYSDMKSLTLPTLQFFANCVADWIREGSERGWLKDLNAVVGLNL